MRVQMGLEPYIQSGGFLSHCQVCFPSDEFGWVEGTSLSPAKDEQSIPQPPIWPTSVGMQPDQWDYQGPLEYFLLEFEKQAPMENEGSGTVQNP